MGQFEDVAMSANLRAWIERSRRWFFGLNPEEREAAEEAYANIDIPIGISEQPNRQSLGANP